MISEELIIFFSAALPVTELRGAIPFAVIHFGFAPAKAFILSFLGNILPVFPLLLFFKKASEYLSRRFVWFSRFFARLFERTRTKHTGHFIDWGDLALFLFVAVPLPLTGVYSGIVAAFVFDIPVKHAFWSIALGALAAGAIVTAATVLGEDIIKLLFL